MPRIKMDLTELTRLHLLVETAIDDAKLNDEQRSIAERLVHKRTPLGRKIRCVHIGKRFGKLRVLGVHFFSHDKNRYFVIVCDCGHVKMSQEPGVISGHTISCGCFNREFNQGRVTHGHSRVGHHTVEYNTWLNIQQRCKCKLHPNFKDYGGRGIKVCDRWLNSFEAFLADMGPRPKGPPRYTIEREDVNGDYTPDNCVWATYAVQSRNKRNSRRAAA